jgi:hypothetical protein
VSSSPPTCIPSVQQMYRQPRQHQQRSIVDDFIDLLVDVHDLNCLHARSGDGPSRGGPYKAELELLQESRELSAALRAEANQPVPQHKEEQPPFILNVAVGLETLVLEVAVMQILFRVSLRHQRSSMESVDDLVFLPCSPEKARREALGTGRRFYQASDDLEDFAHTISSILTRPFPARDDPVSSAIRKSTILAVRSKIAACYLLQAVVRDAVVFELSSEAIVIPVATSVVRACSLCLQMPLEGSGTPRLLDDPATAYWFGQYRAILASLLLRVAPIRLGDSRANGDVGGLSRQHMLHAVLRPHLMDAASYIVPSQAVGAVARGAPPRPAAGRPDLVDSCDFPPRQVP